MRALVLSVDLIGQAVSVEVDAADVTKARTGGRRHEDRLESNCSRRRLSSRRWRA